VDGLDVEEQRVSSSRFGSCASMCGPGLLLLGIGALIGGAVPPSHTTRYLPSLLLNELPSSGLCDSALVEDIGADRVVSHKYCVNHTSLDTFATKADGEDVLSFLVIGDWGRDGMCCQRDVAVQMGRAAEVTGAATVLNTGDNFYPIGIPSITAEQVVTSWREVYNEEGLENVEWWSCLGNHDWGQDPQAQIKLEKVEPNWFMPNYTYAQRFPRANLGPLNVSARVVFLDTTPALSFNRDYPEVEKFLTTRRQSADEYLQDQISLLRREFSNATETWKIVVAHHPVFTSSEHYDEDHITLREAFLKEFEELGVHAYFNGHDHGLELHEPTNSKTSFFLSGAGSKVRPAMQIRDEGFRFHHSTTGGFLSVSANTNIMKVQFIDMFGSLLLEKVISR